MLNENQIKELEAKGFKRWQKGNMDRLYIHACALGLECVWRGARGMSSVKDAKLDGVVISHSMGYKLYMAKTWIDIKTGEFHGEEDSLIAKAKKLANI